MPGYQITIETKTRIITINLPPRKGRVRRPATTAVAESAPADGPNALPGWLTGRRFAGTGRVRTRG